MPAISSRRSGRKTEVSLSPLQAVWLAQLLRDEIDRVDSIPPQQRSPLDRRDRRYASAIHRKLLAAGRPETNLDRG